MGERKTGLDMLLAALGRHVGDIVQTLFPRHVHTTTGFLVSVDSEGVRQLAINHDGTWRAEAREGNAQPGDLLDLIQLRRGGAFQDALTWACQYLGLPELRREVLPPRTVAGRDVGYAERRGLAVSQRRLSQHSSAMASLQGPGWGLRVETIQHFRLGLGSSFNRISGQARYRDCLTYPQFDSLGHPRSRFLRQLLEGISTVADPRRGAWAGGVTSTYWVTPAGSRRDLLVCEDVADGWRIWQALQGTPVADRLCIVASTQGRSIPAEWRWPAFWATWANITVAARLIGEAGRWGRELGELAAREVKWLRSPDGSDPGWSTYFQLHSSADFIGLLQEAPAIPVELSVVESQAVPLKAGLHHVTPVDLSRAFVNGYLYYPFRALEVEQQAGQSWQRWRTLVLRSDGRVCRASVRPAAPGTPREDRVLALDDGTVLLRLPVAQPQWSTFTTDAITRFVAARAARQSALTMTPGEMLDVLGQHLRSQVRLSHEHDYALLAYVAVTSYVQAVFDAVPLVLVVGPAGSGKSQLGAALAQVSCNAVVLNGQTSAASVARVVDSVSGLAVIDDLEGIGAKTRNKGEFSDLIQQLKVSYKQATARKAWTNTRTMQIEELNLYGIKVINNTQGADPVLETRMLRIVTRRMDRQALDSEPRPPAVDGQTLQNLRSNLHIWAMEQAQSISQRYRQGYASSSERHEEISAPLRLLAKLMEHSVSATQLDLALTAQTRQPTVVERPAELLKAAVTALIRQGYWEFVTMPHLALEMQRQTGDGSPTSPHPEWQKSRWIGRQLRRALMVDPAAREHRPRLWGRQVRQYALSETFVQTVEQEQTRAGHPLPEVARHPLAFCEGIECGSCSYREICDLKPLKQAVLRDHR
jgi:energy-coupling factor transporter ATP-binding protein EcfA2